MTSVRDSSAKLNSYHQYLRSPQWEALSEAAKTLAGHRCRICNRSGELHVHHRTYERLGREIMDDLTVLCDECHALYHVAGRIRIPPGQLDLV